MSSYRRRSSRRRPASSGTGVACVLAALALVAVMGVTLRGRATSTAAPAPAPVVAAAVVPRTAPPPRAPVVRPVHPLDVLTKTVREAERKTPSIRGLERGPAFDEARIELLAKVSTARDELGTWLDAHPSDDRANRLWDRVLRLYVALKKL